MNALTLRWVTLEEVRRLPPLPSGYSTDAILQLERSGDVGEERWVLSRVPLTATLNKTYDRGTAEEWLSTYLDEGEATRMSFLVAERGPNLVGLLAVRKLDWNATLWLLDIRVRRSARRTGVGSALMAALKEFARESEVRGILVETQTTNLPAVRFYQKHGFGICGFNDHLYSNEDRARREVGLYLFWELEDDAGS